ncbi:MAG: cytochrome C biogenesis protein [Kiritimatiellales bacterium]|nr:cytochrome c biogenesis protein CcdA [Pontiella sp.]NNJ70580.1 cytochrome C biogenesis protein [Kiritimatiellales bacterium]
MSDLFQFLEYALTHSTLAAFAAAFAWGVCSMVLSPCHLAAIPLIIAYVNEQNSSSVRSAAWLAFVFAFGILITIALAGVAAVSLGYAVGDTTQAGTFVVSAVFILFGLDMVDVITIPWFGAKKESVKAKGALGALVLGLVFGLAAGACTFAFLAPILAIAFDAGGSNVIFGCLLVTLFGVGHTSVLVFAGISAERAAHFARWNRATKASRKIRFVLGVLLIGIGLYLLYKAI